MAEKYNHFMEQGKSWCWLAITTNSEKCTHQEFAHVPWRKRSRDIHSVQCLNKCIKIGEILAIMSKLVLYYNIIKGSHIYKRALPYNTLNI